MLRMWRKGKKLFIKGHIAKECNNRVREAKTLTENRIKAILSQQNSFKLILPVTKITNIFNNIKYKNNS